MVPDGRMRRISLTASFSAVPPSPSTSIWRKAARSPLSESCARADGSRMEPAEAGLRLSLTSSTSLAGQDRMAPLREVASSPAHPSRGRAVAMASRTSSLPDLLEGHRTMPLPIRTVIPDHSPARDRATEYPATSLSEDRRHTGTMTYHFDI